VEKRKNFEPWNGIENMTSQILDERSNH